MSQVKIDVSQLIAFEKQLEMLDEKLKNKVCKNIAQSLGKSLEDNVKKKTPAVTGHLRKNWTTKEEKLTNGYQVMVFNQVEYAPYVEYGHRIVRHKKVVGYVKGRYMLTRATLEIRKIETQRAKRHLKRALKEHFNDK